ncbi:MAG: SMP-30/gluconolactonase/LRE family protein, partial [Clostridia bacterium]
DDMGNLWVALWGGSKVVCYKAETGEKIDEVIMPEKNVSCCAFGGKDMNKLFVTTASDDKTGALYCVDMGEIKGRKSFVYKNIN